MTTDDAGKFVFVPTRDGTVMTLSADKGKVVASPTVSPPDVRTILRAETGSAALRAAGALDAFTTSGAADDPSDGSPAKKPTRPARPPRPRSAG